MPLNQSEPPSETPLSFNSQSVLTILKLCVKTNLFCFRRLITFGDNVSTSSTVKYSSLGNKELCKMTCHMKYIFVWILLIPQPTGYVFIWDFVLTFSVFTFFFRIRTRSTHLITNVLYSGDFYIDSSRLRCLLNCIRCFNSKS